MTADTHYRYPPGPAESSSEQVRHYIEAPLDFWAKCHDRFGDTVTLDLGSLGRIVLLTDPLHIREVFRLQPGAFVVAPYNEHYRYVMGDCSLLLTDGIEHRRQRRLLQPLFRHESLAAHVDTLRTITQQRIAAWPRDRAFNPRSTLHDLTYSSMVHLLFGNTDSATSRSLIDSYRQSVTKQVGSWGPWRNFARMQPVIRGQLALESATRRADPDSPGFYTSIANARTPEGDAITVEECEDHVFTMLVAGVDTSAISLAWALHWLSRTPDIRHRLLAELTGDPATAARAAIIGLPVLDAVFRETLRMYPVVPTPSGRKLLHDMAFFEWMLERDTTLLPCPYLVHRRPDLYPQPDAFRPERFLERTYATHEYLPFGGGARICVGEKLAELEFKLVLATILGEFTLADSTAPALKPVRHGTLLAPPDDMEITLS